MRGNSLIALLIVVAAIGFAPAPATAQTSTPPDLTGRWSLNLAKSKLAKSTRIQTEVLVIAFSGTDISFDFTDDSQKKTAMTYTPDGKEHILWDKPLRELPTGSQACPRELPHQQVYSKARWEKSGLTVELHFRGPGPCYPPRNDTCPCENDSMSADHWHLSSDGRTLTRKLEDSRDVMGNYATHVYVYEKQ